MGRMGRLRRATLLSLLFLAAERVGPKPQKQTVTIRHVCQNPTFNVAKLHFLDMFFACFSQPFNEFRTSINLKSSQKQRLELRFEHLLQDGAP